MLPPPPPRDNRFLIALEFAAGAGLLALAGLLDRIGRGLHGVARILHGVARILERSHQDKANVSAERGEA